MAKTAHDEDVYMADLAKQAERFEEMVEFMKKVVSSVSGTAVVLTAAEIDLLSIAYKNVINSRRNASKILSSIEQKENIESNAEKVRRYRLKVEDELSDICHNLMELIDSKLLIDSATGVAKVIFLKMKGECNRYLAEIKIGDEKEVAANNALSAYKAAQTFDQAVAELDSLDEKQKEDDTATLI